jgi:5,10-methylene-tetrahydrofolate dehydrogenase/methenyl tetrahydrofolate cyclohydrolase
LGAFYAGRNQVLPPAVGVVEAVMKNTKYQIQNAACAVVGLGSLVGQPVSTWLKGKCREIYLLDKGSDLSLLKNADVVVCGAGVPGLVKPEMLKDNTLVIDFGYGLKDGKPSGDFNPSDTRYEILNTIYYTPTPGGTGPILVAKLFENFFLLNADRC